MDSRELRIGNYVQDRFGKIMRVVILGHLENPNYIHAEFENGGAVNIFTPIPLTEEWLLRFGFHRNNESWGNFDGKEYKKIGYYFQHSGLNFWGGFQFDLISSIGDFYISALTETSSDDHIISNGVKYVHQLQNLYFALTGQELEIK